MDTLLYIYLYAWLRKGDLNRESVHISPDGDERRTASSHCSSDPGFCHGEPVRDLQFIQFIADETTGLKFLKSQFGVLVNSPSDALYPPHHLRPSRHLPHLRCAVPPLCRPPLQQGGLVLGVVSVLGEAVLLQVRDPALGRFCGSNNQGDRVYQDDYSDGEWREVGRAGRIHVLERERNERRWFAEREREAEREASEERWRGWRVEWEWIPREWEIILSMLSSHQNNVMKLI